MVANVLGIDYAELLGELRRIRREHGDDPEYQAIRQQLPADWSI